MKSTVGRETELPGIERIDETTIIRYAQAISDLNPLYLDAGYAKKTEYRGIVAPPTLLFDIIPASVVVGEDGRDLTRIKLPGFKLMRGGNEYQFFEPVRPGDEIRRKRRIVDVYERKSKKLGKIISVVYDTTYTNQKGMLLGINRETLIFFK